MHPKLKLLAIFAAFAGPFFIAMLVYFFPEKTFLPPTKSHGDLISPAQPLTDLVANGVTTEKLPTDAMKGKWTLAYWGEPHCNLFCQTELFKMRQVRLSVGKDISRLQTFYLVRPGEMESADATDQNESLHRLNLRNPRLTIARIEKNSEIGHQMDAYPLHNIYLIDPMGNLMMRYSDLSHSKGILKDIKKLLKISKIG